MKPVLSIIQVVISAALIAAILLQQRGAGGSSIFGGGGGGGSYYTKRGFEKILFVGSIILAGLFIITAFINLLI